MSESLIDLGREQPAEDQIISATTIVGSMGVGKSKYISDHGTGVLIPRLVGIRSYTLPGCLFMSAVR